MCNVVFCVVYVVVSTFKCKLFWCQSFGDVSLYVCSLYFSLVWVAE